MQQLDSRFSRALGLGLALSLLVSTPAFILNLHREIPSNRIATCEVDHAVRQSLRVVFVNGERATLSAFDSKVFERCPSLGSLVEKKRGELGYWIDNKYFGTSTSTLASGVLSLVSGVALAVLIAQWITRSQRAGRART
jgi:hypothetical protein